VKELKLIVNIHGFPEGNASEAEVEAALKSADSERIRNLIESAVLDVLDAECVNPGVLDVLVDKAGEDA
jgi:hypothetical protein